MTNNEMLMKLVKKLWAENRELKKALEQERQEHNEDREFAFNVIAAALAEKENHRIMYRKAPAPQFELEESINMIIVLKEV